MIDTHEICKLLRTKGISPGIGFTSPNAQTKWYKKITKAMGDSFKEEFGVIDWGCGCGRYLHWVNHNLGSYTYYGFETNTEYGISMVDFAKEISSELSNDNNNINFGLTDNMEVVMQAYRRCSVILAADVFTYYDFDQVKSYIDSIEEFLNKDGNKLIFSIMKQSEMVDQEKKVHPGKGRWGVDESYHWCTLSDEEISSLGEGRSLEEVDDIMDGGFPHTLYRLEKTKV